MGCGSPDPGRRTPHGDRRQVDELAFSPDGGTLAALTGDGNLTVWDVATRSLRYEPVRTAGPGLLAGVAFGADGTMLVATAATGVRLFDAATGASLGGFASGHASDLSLSADGTLAAFAGCERRRGLERCRHATLVAGGGGGLGGG